MNAADAVLNGNGSAGETGNQAEVLNQIMTFLHAKNPEEIKFNQERLKELIGHTPLQVCMGAIWGVISAFITYNLFYI